MPINNAITNTQLGKLIVSIEISAEKAKTAALPTIESNVLIILLLHFFLNVTGIQILVSELYLLF